jgi:hypothetical protein
LHRTKLKLKNLYNFKIFIQKLVFIAYNTIVLLPGFQKGGISRLLEEKGREQFGQKGQFALYKEKLTEFHSF